MRKSKPCPVCKKDYPNVTYHIRKLAMNKAFENWDTFEEVEDITKYLNANS